MYPLIIPEGDFTIAELEVLNPKCEKSNVRMRLAKAIASGHVDIVSSPQTINGPSTPFLYRKTER
jgi:hypothetical protein